MAIEQRDVYLLPHPITGDETQRHPFIVLSCDESNIHERTFLAVMITSSEYKRDDYSFEVDDSMFENKLDKSRCHVRMHLIMLCLNEEIIGKRLNKMRSLYFKELMKSIGEQIFNYDFKPI